MAPSPMISLILRAITFVFLFISFIILCSTSATVNDRTFRFNDVITYRYSLFTLVMGVVYTLLQIAFTIYHIRMGKPLAGNALLKFDFYADKIMSYTLATGAAATFGASVDLENFIGASTPEVEKFFEMAYASASLLLLGFFCSIASSIFSSFSFPKFN